MDHWDILFEREMSKRLKERLSKKQAEVAEGRANSFDDYRYRCGEINALTAIQDDIQEIRANTLGGSDGKEK